MLLRSLAVFFVNYSVVYSFSSNHIHEVLLTKCSNNNHYTAKCFQLDVLRMLSLLGDNTRVPLGPGLALVGTDRTKNIVNDLDTGVVTSRSQGPVDNFLMTAIEKYLGSLNLTVQLKDSHLIRGARSIVSDVFEGRAKKPMWILIGTIGAVALALLAALTGQALMASILALVMSGVMMFRGAIGGNFGMPPAASPHGRITAYEIVRPGDYAAEPMSVVHDHSHHHSALTGRMKKSRWAFVGTILAIVFAVMAGLSGSAVMASMIALVLSAVVVLRAALGGGAGFGAPAAAYGYAIPVGHPTASGRITAYELSPEYYMDDQTHSSSVNPSGAYASYSRQTLQPMTIPKAVQPTTAVQPVSG